MLTKNAHHTHENASGQDTTLPNCSFFFFPCQPPENTQSHQNSNKFTTSQSSQNISKTQRFSHAAKTRKSSVSWIVRYFLKLHKITSFQIKNTIFTSFKKGQNISRMHTFHKAATTTNTCYNDGAGATDDADDGT